MSKKTKLRNCPAAGRQIEAYECAEGRHTTFNCPELCPFNAFSTARYDDASEIEKSATSKLFAWVKDNAANPHEFETDVRRMLGNGPSPDFPHAIASHSVFRKDSHGETCLGKWERMGFPGCGADERVYLRAMARIRLAMIETHHVMDDRRVEVVDLLNPEGKPFVIVDRAFALTAVRFEVVCAYVLPMPHYWRVMGAAAVMPDFHPIPAEETVLEIVRHLGGPETPEGAREWLKEHLTRFNKALTAVTLARRKAMFENVDGQTGKAVYAIASPINECLDLLSGVPAVEEDSVTEKERTEGFTGAKCWFATPTDPEYDLQGKFATIGRILIGPTHWRIETFGADKLARMRSRFECLMERRVRFEGERLDDLAARLGMDEPAFDAALVPPALMRETPRVAISMSRMPIQAGVDPVTGDSTDYILQRQANILDNPIPALDGKSPRQAASDPALRPKLIRWMKYWIAKTDARNLELGRNDDTNWMARELGLNEILFPAPPERPHSPRRERPDHSDSDFEPLDGFESDDALYLTLPKPPPLPERPWTTDEMTDSFRAALETMNGVKDLPSYFEHLDYPLFDELRQITKDILDPLDFAILCQCSATVVFCYAPNNTRPPHYAPEDLANHLTNRTKEILGFSTDIYDEQFAKWLDSTPQPKLLSAILAMALLSSKEEKRLLQKPGSQAIVIGSLAAVIDTLDGASRG